MILRGDPGTLVAMGDDRDLFLDWLQSAGCNAVNAQRVYYNTDNRQLRAVMISRTVVDNQERYEVDEDGNPITTDAYFNQGPLDERLLGRWLAYIDIRVSESKTLLTS